MLGFTNHLIEEHSKLDNKNDQKYDSKKDMRRDFNQSNHPSSPHDFKNFDFRLESCRSKNLLFSNKNDSQRVDSRLFTKMDSEVKSSRSLINVKPKGLERWKNIIEMISKK